MLHLADVLISLALAGVMWTQVIDFATGWRPDGGSSGDAGCTKPGRLRSRCSSSWRRCRRPVENPRSPDWIPVSFKLTQETLDGPPAVGFQATLGRGTGGWNKPEAIQRDSDANGMVDFGVVQPGDWEFRISRRLEHGSSWHASGKLNVGLGNKIEKAIICPRICRFSLS